METSSSSMDVNANGLSLLKFLRMGTLSFQIGMHGKLNIFFSDRLYILILI